MHAKYILFSKTRDSAGTLRSNVVWFGSANHTGNTGTEAFNNTVTAYSDAELYNEFYNHVWLPMWEQRTYTDNDYCDAAAPRGYFGSTNVNVAVYQSPEQQYDLVASRLSGINPDADCRIRVMQNGWSDDRIAVAEKIVELKRGGCRINVVVSSDGGAAKMQDQVKATLLAAGIPVRSTAKVHDKAFVVYARYAGSAVPRYMVFTGSHNLTAPALRQNDELFVKIHDNQTIHDGFYRHFLDAYSIGTPVS